MIMNNISANTNKRGLIIRSWAICLALMLISTTSPASTPRLTQSGIQIFLPKTRIHADELGLIINTLDPVSVETGRYYQLKRQIPDKNILRIQIPERTGNLSLASFKKIQAQVNNTFGADIQALALTWAAPYRVDCMSITAAFTFGYDKAFCSKSLCAHTKPSLYFNSNSTAPYTDYAIRPTMSIAAISKTQARELIDRGVASDASQPPGTAYLLSTWDRHRNVRSGLFPRIRETFSGMIKTLIIKSNTLRNRNDVMFYFTGLQQVQNLDSLSFHPGAVADHLTSTGGKLTDSKQMSALRWLEAGATGSYGTVKEPCNLPGKFPNPGILMSHYLQGETLLEAYWKSVQQPGEGIFIGEPLAAPYDGVNIEEADNIIRLTTRALKPGSYHLTYAKSPIGPFHRWPRTLVVKPGQTVIELSRQNYPVIRIDRIR
ncbi:MAG: TIGR03790 family protein [Gammaproteobacteria bacterium]